jgi:hypothetical protein
MTRSQAESSNSLSVFFLKKHGYFDKNLSWKSGTITWTYGYNENKSSISIAMRRDNWNTPNERTFLNLNYTHTDHWGGEKSSMNFDIEMDATPCRYGGKRYWFICPLTKNGQYCGRRVGVIYSIGKWFGCRHCGNIAYQSQFEGGKFRIGSVCEPDVEKAYAEVKRYSYKGKPTKKYKRYLILSDKMDNCWIRAAARFGKFI